MREASAKKVELNGGGEEDKTIGKELLGWTHGVDPRKSRSSKWTKTAGLHKAMGVLMRKFAVSEICIAKSSQVEEVRR